MSRTTSDETAKPPCPTCGPIGAGASATWKDANAEWLGTESNIPATVSRLVHVAGDAEAVGGRGRGLKRCLDCGAWFEWLQTYEFLANGSEDDESYSRASDERVAIWLSGKVPPRDD